MWPGPVEGGDGAEADIGEVLDGASTAVREVAPDALLGYGSDCSSSADSDIEGGVEGRAPDDGEVEGQDLNIRFVRRPTSPRSGGAPRTDRDIRRKARKRATQRQEIR